jgi:protein-disulfide isomerase
MYENQDQLSDSQYSEWAMDLGLDVAAFEQCYDSGEFDQKVTAQFAEGHANGISGTPGFIINGVVLSGALPYEAFAEILDEQS